MPEAPIYSDTRLIRAVRSLCLFIIACSASNSRYVRAVNKNGGTRPPVSSDTDNADASRRYRPRLFASAIVVVIVVFILIYISVMTSAMIARERGCSRDNEGGAVLAAKFQM